MKTRIFGAIIFAVIAFILDFLYYSPAGLNMGSSTLIPGVMRETPEFILLLCGYLVVGYVFVSIYLKWARGTHNFRHGAEYGLWMGLLLGVGNNLIWYSVSNIMTLKSAMMDALYMIVLLMIIGGVISLMAAKTEPTD
jgi:hypothetical protein